MTESGTSTPQGREPGGWELYRGIERVEKAIRDQSTAYVTQAVYQLEVRALRDGMAEVKAEQAALEQRQDAAAQAKVQQDEQLRRTKVQQWFAIGTVVLAGAITFIGNLIFSALQQGVTPP